MDYTIRLDAIAKPAAAKGGKFGPFTSAISASALLGIYIGMFSILIDKF